MEKSLQNKSYNLSLRAALCSPLFAQFVGAMQWELHEFTCLKGVGSLGNSFTLEQVQGQSEEHPHRCIMKDEGVWMRNTFSLYSCLIVNHSS